MANNYGPSFSFTQFPFAVNDSDQDSSGGNGGAGGASGAATSNPFAQAVGSGGAGGAASADGGGNSGGDALGAGTGGDGLGAGGSDGLLDLLGLGGSGLGTGGAGTGAATGGDALGGLGGLADAGDGGAGASAAVTGTAVSGAGGAGGIGGAGGANSADQSLTTSATLGFQDSFTDDDGFDLKGATVARSFNQDNDGVDNSHGIISGSNVANGPQTDVGNTTQTTTVIGSHNTDAHHTTVLNDVDNDDSDHSVTVTGSGNDSSTHTDVDVSNVANTDASTAIGGNYDPDLVDVDVHDLLNGLDLTGDLPIDIG